MNGIAIGVGSFLYCMRISFHVAVGQRAEDEAQGQKKRGADIRSPSWEGGEPKQVQYLKQRSLQTEEQETKPETLTTKRAAALRVEVVMWVESLAEELGELQRQALAVEVGLRLGGAHYLHWHWHWHWPLLELQWL